MTINNRFVNSGQNLTFKSSLTRKNFISVLEKLDYAIFDFDGTLYPKLALFDVTKTIFEEKSKTKKLTKLMRIAQIYSNGNFIESYLGFLNLLKNESEAEFEERARSIIKNSYKYANLTISKLKENYDIDSYLISLTSDFIANSIRRQFKFKKLFSVHYLLKTRYNSLLFNGKTDLVIEEPKNMKNKMLHALMKKNPNKKFACFCNSSDDFPIIQNAALKIGVNPSQSILSLTEFDIILSTLNADPWEAFYNIL